MLSKGQMERDLEVYFWHYKGKNLTRESKSKTSLARLADGELSGGGCRGVSLVPVGVEMDDLAYLNLISRMDVALVALRNRDMRLSNLIVDRYGAGRNVDQVCEGLGVCRRTFYRMEKKAFGILLA